jgi:hypothetical protein
VSAISLLAVSPAGCFPARIAVDNIRGEKSQPHKTRRVRSRDPFLARNGIERPVSARHNTVASTRDSSVYRAEPQRGPIGRMLTRLASFPTVRPKVQGRNRGWNDARF